MLLTQVLDCLPDIYPGTHGAVLERTILQPLTHRVGELCVAGIQIAYYGTQCSVPNADGSDVYGGSALRAYRRSLESLVATALPPLEQRGGRTGVQIRSIPHLRLSWAADHAPQLRCG
ncbi:hypothetical protein DXO170_08605 [Xanthomonas oryzae pv. oryzae]|uniref:Uncharacterized protein n=3 Tax=Xanthomonas oryzae pv. oryzae TaxID=64187 RepID=Q5GUB6_XANOR|nr:conserved hypothetical protein [Xanthomonas oryzae pv. oryzae KACC 10331]ACD56991.1 hypothetical protein PXO_03885 [Xanthomonas oryzae pv. oryzae PXO99A]ALZ70385.1 hypothetical protein APZ20_01510 [Xanthomonas oryzae pv. oryzae]AOS04276.1 hypothetical protein ATY42_21690 [Xanthomonas oryzae pv. oryzae]AOS05056.1 hypothetical protein ATY43_01565 [Xanthomonas oryzae pv. oryzae]